MPAPLMCTCAGETGELSEHGPVAASETGSPEVAVAAIPKSAAPKTWSPIAANEIVWSAFAIENDCATGVAAL